MGGRSSRNSICNQSQTQIHSRSGTHGLLAIVVPEDEYRLEIDNEDFEYKEPQQHEPYNEDIMGGEDEHERKVMEAEYSEVKDDY